MCPSVCPAERYGNFKWCCEKGMKWAPTYRSCLDEAKVFVHKHKKLFKHERQSQRCVMVYKECCEHLLRSIGQGSVIARNGQCGHFCLQHHTLMIPTAGAHFCAITIHCCSTCSAHIYFIADLPVSSSCMLIQTVVL